MNNIQSVTFDDIPDELLLEVFSHLGSFDTCRRVGQVCRHWRQVVQDEVAKRLKNRFAHCIDQIKSEDYWQVAAMVSKGLPRIRREWRDLPFPKGYSGVHSYLWAKVGDQDLLVASCAVENHQAALCCWTLPQGEIWYQYELPRFHGLIDELRLCTHEDGRVIAVGATVVSTRIWNLNDKKLSLRFFSDHDEIGSVTGLLTTRIDGASYLLTYDRSHGRVGFLDLFAPRDEVTITRFDRQLEIPNEKIRGLVEGQWRGSNCLFILAFSGLCTFKLPWPASVARHLPC